MTVSILSTQLSSSLPVFIRCPLDCLFARLTTTLSARLVGLYNLESPLLSQASSSNKKETTLGYNDCCLWESSWITREHPGDGFWA